MLLKAPWPCQQRRQRVTNDGPLWHPMPSGSSQLKSSLLLIHKRCACPCFAHSPLCVGDVIWLECVCVCVCVRLCVSLWAPSLQRRLMWSLRISSVTARQHYGCSLFWHPPPSLLRCSSLTLPSMFFVRVPLLKGMMWQLVSCANLHQWKGSLCFVLQRLFDPVMKSLPAGSNDSRGVHFLKEWGLIMWTIIELQFIQILIWCVPCNSVNPKRKRKQRIPWNQVRESNLSFRHQMDT